MHGLLEHAAAWGLETEHWDGLGHHWKVEASVIEHILAAMAAGDRLPARSDIPATPIPAFQGNQNLPQRTWILATQLYGVRSRRNWGHGDFGDLSKLIEISSMLGAAGVGLNPLHALFDDKPTEASPYFPSSRFFLNPLYISVEDIPEFPHALLAELNTDLAAAARQELVDYDRVSKAKSYALRKTYDNFQENRSQLRRAQFEDYRTEQSPMLAFFAAFEILRRRFNRPWWEWPNEWRKPNRKALADLQSSAGNEFGYYEFVQWIAHQQLASCRDEAKHRALPIGLYLDLAVGVRPDGFDAWYDQNFILRDIEIGAPPDRLNTQGQRWGLAGSNPVSLLETDCKPFRLVLRASMQYAGAIRLDHVLGLNRFYLIPRDVTADRGAYVRFPFAALLRAASDESHTSRCVAIGEDLGTVPPGFRETLAAWGLWAYQVMLFERAGDGGFIAPELYRQNALVTFATHDLPTLRGWLSAHDLAVKRNLGLDPGESESERATTKDALMRAMAWRGLPAIDFLSVTRFLADTPSRLLAVNIEDALDLIDQINVPGTIDQHPNWKRRLPVNVEDLLANSALAAAADIMTATGRDARQA